MKLDPLGNMPNTPHQNKLSDQGGEIHLRYEALFHNTLDGIFIYNYVQKKIVDCNKAAGTLLGYEDDRELIGKSDLEFVPKYDVLFPGQDLHEYIVENGRRVMAGESFSTQGIFLGFNDQRYLVKANVVPTFYNSGEAFIIFKDVTNEVLSKKALRTSEGRYKDIYENSHEAIIYIDSKSLDIIMCNNRALDLFGAADIQEFRKIDSTRFYLDDCSKPLSSKRMYISIVRNALYNGRSSFSLWFKNLKDVLIRIEGVLVCDNSKRKHPKLIAFVRNVTELYESQIALHQKNEQLNSYIDSNLQLENFAYLASHDLQTPLRSIISFSQLLEKKLENKLEPSEKELFKFITSSGRSMGEIVNQLLSFSKVERDPIKRTKIDLDNLFNQLKIDMSSDIKRSHASIQLDFDCQEIVADRQKIMLLLRNIFSNSIKFIEKGTTPHIQVFCEEKPLHWLFCVKDNGIGIDEKYHETIFAMFKRLHVKEQYGGSGFGLSMVKKIIDLHKGSIWVESAIGQGTSIYFTLAKKV